MRLLKRLAGLRMWQKLTVIALALGIPAVTLAAFYISSMSYDGGFVRAELDGLTYVDPLNKLNDQITAHRGMVDASVRGDAATKAYFRPKIIDARSKIDELIRQIDAVEARTGTRFGTAARWQQVKGDWAALKDRSLEMKPEDSADRHARLTSEVVAVQAAVSEKSNLILDPILVTYYLQDNLTLRATPLIDFVGQTRAKLHDLAGKKEVTAGERAEVAELLGQVAAARAGFDGNVTVLKDRDPAAYARLAPRYAEAVAAADALVALAREGVLRAPVENGKATVAVRPDEAWEKGTATLDAYQRVNDEGLPVLAGMLTARYNAATYRLYGAAAFITLTLLVAVALVYSIARGITRQVASINGVLGQIGMGNFHARAEVSAADELGDLAFGLNAMLDNTTSLMQSQDEKDQIQASIQKLLEEVGGVAEGDLTRDAEVTENLTGAIADSFNHMLDQLRGIIGNVQKATAGVTGAATEIYASTQHLAGGADQQATQIISTSQAVENMSRSIQQVSENAVQSAAVARQALQNARQGNESVKTTMVGMDRIRDQVQETAKRIKRLGESSQEIGQIIQLIDDIADRTSILALNASIQAAMAGDAGRGFAVVAEEVERLADRSTEATKKIAGLVKTIQSETTEAVGAMEKGIHEVVEGSKLAAQAGQALDEIEGVSDRLAELIQQISQAATQQARVSEGVTRTMTDISGITQQTATGTKQAAESVQSLASLANELGESVAAFKLPAELVEKLGLNGHHKPGTNGHQRNGTNGHTKSGPHGHAPRRTAARF